MAKANISEYSSYMVSGNWGPVLEAAWEVVRPTGGTIYFDEQEVLIETMSNLHPPTFNLVPLILEGDGSSMIRVNVGTAITALNIGNKMRFTAEKVIFASTQLTGDYTDCKELIRATYAQTTLIDKCHFIAIKASDSVICASEGTHRLVIRDTQIGGCAAPAVVKCEWGVPLNMENVTFWDNGNFKADYFTKTPYGVGSWVHCSGAVTQLGANQHSIIDIRNCRFDEAATPHIYVEDYHNVEIEKCSFNLRGTSGAYGIHLKNVNHALIKHCNSGYTTADIPLLKLENCQNVVVVGQSFDTGVYRIEKDSATDLTLIHSDGITITTLDDTRETGQQPAEEI